MTMPQRDLVSMRPPEEASYEDQFEELTHAEPGNASLAGTGTVRGPRFD